MPFGLCNAPGTFQRCMIAISHDMIEKTVEVFMDDFLVFGNSFQTCLSHLEKMLKRCEDTNLCLNWEKSHFMVKEGIVLGYKISKEWIEVDKAKVDVIAKLLHPTTVNDVKKSVGTSTGAQNMAFMTAPSTSSTNDINTANPVYEASTVSPNVNIASPQVSTTNFSDNVVYAFMDENPNGSTLLQQNLEQIHEDGLKEMDLREYRAQRNQDDGVGFDWSNMAEEQVQTNMALMAFSDSEDAREVDWSDKVDQEIRFRVIAGKVQEKEGIEFKIEKFDNASESLDKLIGSQITNTSKKGLGYHVVPPPRPLIYNGPIKLDLSYSGLEFKKHEFKGYRPRDSKQESNINHDKKSDDSKKNSGDSFKKEQESKDTSSFVKSPLNVDKETAFSVDKKIEFVKPKNYDKPVKKSVRYAEMYRSQRPMGDQRNWNGQKSNQLGSDFVMYNKACFICGSFVHVYINCTHYQRKTRVSGNNYNRVDYNYYAKTTHPSAQRNMTPRAVLLKTDLRPFNTARPVYNAHPKPTVPSARPMAHFSKQAQSTVQRPFYKQTTLTNRYFHQKANTVGPRVVYTARPYIAQVNTVRAKRSNEFDGGYVTFGGGAHGGRISGKGILKTDIFDFENVYFVNELKFNLFSVSHMCDKKNCVLLTDTECLVLSSNFKLPDESQILLKIPRKDNMYSFDMKNIVPKESLTCLDNLVRELPIKHFENDQTCVACIKGKQHIATLTKDETNEILKNFIKELENLVDKQVKIIKCDNGTEFKNKVMDDFCREKGIKREYSVTRTPQQNGVAERSNRTLIEAARTMLADFKLPITFWAEAVSIACYVQNRVLIVKPHNKTPYELFRGFKPALSFMRPFGCHVTILNTFDNLGKFDGKSDEGFFVGYSLNSKVFRVYNTRTRKVEENLHIGFFKNKPIIEGNGLKWLFDIDSLTQSMNYVPVAPGIISDESTDASYFDTPSKDVEDGTHNKDDDKDKSEDDSSPKEVNADGQHVNTASLEVNTGRFELNIVDLSLNTASSSNPHSPTDMFKLGASDTLKATHVEFFSDRDAPEVDLGNIPNSYGVLTTLHTRIHKDHPIENVIGRTSAIQALTGFDTCGFALERRPLEQNGSSEIRNMKEAL
uniref:Integrase catalytic domain-containing protein n=2 Tax=Tanacetum cinerariifolium TaxID=118510 RepID=A0A699GI86_TANCI|nr:hypothetical protein [Tanacetum cinerariifolium]